MLKTNEKGITLMSLIIYIIIMLVVLVIIATINNTYRKNVTKMKGEVILEEEFSEFNLYFLEETKKTNNEVAKTYNGNDGTNYTSGEVATDKIEFTSGNIYSWEDPDSDGVCSLYLAKGATEKFEIAYNVRKDGTTKIFTVSKLTSGNTQIQVAAIINGTQKNVTYVLSNKQEYKEENENEYTYGYEDDSVPIPDGFYYVGGIKKYGVVISDNKDDENKYRDFVDVGKNLEGNQFVWIPVNNINSMAVRQTNDSTNANYNNYRGVLYNWNSDPTGNTQFAWSSDGNREIDVVTLTYSLITKKKDIPAFDCDYELVNEALETQYTIESNKEQIANYFKSILQADFNSMVESVSKYGGFYVGRYETGGFDKSKVVVKANEGDRSINWTIWHKMYRLSKTLSSSSVTSSMIYGCQWDQMMKTVNRKKDGGGNEYIVTEANWDRSTRLLESTGSNSNDKVYNIYDLQGNVCEATLEAYDVDSRIARGGKYKSEASASRRITFFPSIGSDEGMGSRLILYIK